MEWSENIDSVCACFCISFSLADNQINGCSLDKQEDRGRREVEVKPAELALTEEHMSCVTGKNWRLCLCLTDHCSWLRNMDMDTVCMDTVCLSSLLWRRLFHLNVSYLRLSQGILEESLQQYGSLIPIHVDDIVEKLQDIFSESFSQPHRSVFSCSHWFICYFPEMTWMREKQFETIKPCSLWKTMQCCLTIT